MLVAGFQSLKVYKLAGIFVPIRPYPRCVGAVLELSQLIAQPAFSWFRSKSKTL